MADDQIHTGGCLCGAIRYRVRGALPGVKACHCTQCRRTSGHYDASTAVSTDHFELQDHGALKWFRSSDIAERGFCGTCGSSLFWRPLDQPQISIAAGSLDSPTGLKTLLHMHCASKGDYYEISDGLPQFQGDDEA